MFYRNKLQHIDIEIIFNGTLHLYKLHLTIFFKDTSIYHFPKEFVEHINQVIVYYLINDSLKQKCKAGIILEVR